MIYTTLPGWFIFIFLVEFYLLYGLCPPNLRHEGSQTALLRLDLVQPVSSDTGAQGQQPQGDLVVDAVDTVGNVVNNAGLESHVAVIQQEPGEGGIEKGAGAGQEWGHNKRHQPDTDEPFGGPVVRAVHLGWRWSNVGIVNRTYDATGRLCSSEAAHHRPRQAKGRSSQSKTTSRFVQTQSHA